MKSDRLLRRRFYFDLLVPLVTAGSVLALVGGRRMPAEGAHFLWLILVHYGLTIALLVVLVMPCLIYAVLVELGYYFGMTPRSWVPVVYSAVLGALCGILAVIVRDAGKPNTASVAAAYLGGVVAGFVFGLIGSFCLVGPSKRGAKSIRTSSEKENA